MTARTSNFSGLLYYNPVARGFNPVVSATLTSYNPTVDEGNSLEFYLVTWNVPNGTELYLRVANLVNLTTDRFDATYSSVVIENNRGSFTITVDADNSTAAGAQTYDVIISKAINGPALASLTVGVNDTSQDPQILTLDLDPENYVPANQTTITITTTYATGGYAGGTYLRYDGTIATQPSVGDTFVWSGTTYTIYEVNTNYPPGQENLYLIAFAPSLIGSISVGSTIDISHGSNGLTVTDSSGQNHPGLIVGTPVIVNQGMDGAYFDFTAGNTYIEVPTLQNSAYKSVTMSSWFNSDNVSGNRSLIAKEIAYKMRLVQAPSGANSNLDVLAGWDGSSWLYSQVNNYTIPNNQWHHVAVTIASSQIAIYIDGQQIATAVGVGAMPTNSQKLMIGSYGDGTSEFFNGNLGPSRLYTYALTEQNIADYYKTTAGRYGVYAAQYGSQTSSPQNQMIFQSVFTQDVTGQTISGYGCPAGVTVTQQTPGVGVTILTLSQAIDTFAVMYSFRSL